MGNHTNLLELELETITPSGDGLARHEGMVIFVPFGIPGERVQARITERKKRFARAQIVEVLRTAPQRVAPHCRYFGVCGGCQWQHIHYETQLAYKRSIVQEQFARIGKFENVTVLPCIPSPHPYGYRRRARLARSANHKPGYRAAQSHLIVEVDHCPVLEPLLNQKLEAAAATGLTEVTEEWELRPDDAVIELAGFSYHVSPESFFQVNRAIAARLVAEVLHRLQLTGNQEVLDLYCGVGLFTLPISLQSRRVVGVEASPTAVADARRNLAALAATHSNMAETEVIAAPVEEALTQPLIQDQRWDAIVLDPPRAGVERSALAQIVALSPRRLVYVSCDPATLARDARFLVDAGYQLDSIQPLDMFPQTHHVESVVLLESSKT